MNCPLCHGEGCLEAVIPGGYFDDSAGCWHPLERLVARPECGGCGMLAEMDDPLEWERSAWAAYLHGDSKIRLQPCRET